MIGKVAESLPEQLLTYTEELKYGNYEKIDVERLLGTGGYFAIVDKNANLIYNCNPKKEISISSSDLPYITSYGEGTVLEVKEFRNSRGQNQISIIKYFIEEDANIIDEAYILDNNLNVLYSSKDRNKKSFTAREYELFTDTIYKNYSLKKYPFLNQAGEQYTMLIYQSRNADDILSAKLSRIGSDALSWFGVAYLILIGMFIFWLNRKVKKPLRLLHQALEEFSKGKRQQYLDYKGPQEFVEICDSFNVMSQKLYESEQKSKKLEQDKQKMLADISHDLKTPITVIQGYANAINDGLIPVEDKPQYLKTIAEKSNSLNELVNIFYEYSKMEHPDYKLTLQPYDICVFTRDYMAGKYNEMEIDGFLLDVDIPDEHIYCNIDKVQLRRAFENIVSNSIKHNQSGTTLFCSLQKQNDQVRIIFADNGSGIPLEVSKNIFEPFIVGEKSRSKHGSGLGLAVSKKIVEAHGGTVELILPPEGSYKTQFQIMLPIMKDQKH